MNLGTIVLRGLLHRPARSLLTVGGIAIGVAAVVGMSSLASGFERNWEQVYASREVDLVVARPNSRSPLPGVMSQTVQAQIEAVDGVGSSAALLSDVLSIEDASDLIVFGWQPATFLWDHLRITSGSMLTETEGNQVLLGAVAAERLSKAVGDRVQIETEEFVVQGVFESSALIENTCMVLPLAALQRVTEHEGKVNFINVRAKAGLDPAQLTSLKARLEAVLPGLRVFSSGEIARENPATRLAEAMSWATTALAIALGGLGITNTILMSVFERTHEIGILLAVGWRRSRVLCMVLIESVLLSVMGGVAGVVLGIAGLQLLVASRAAGGNLSAAVTPRTIAFGIALSVLLGTVGGLYPALRASLLSPARALEHS